MYLAKYFRRANRTLIKQMIPLFWQRGPGETLNTTFEIPSTDKHPFVALLSPPKSHGSFSLRARLSDVGKTQLPICRGCAMFANVKQRLKMRPHKLWRMDWLICFLALTLMPFLGGVQGGRGCCCDWAIQYTHTSGQQGEYYEFHLGQDAKGCADG